MGSRHLEESRFCLWMPASTHLDRHVRIILTVSPSVAVVDWGEGVWAHRTWLFI